MKKTTLSEIGSEFWSIPLSSKRNGEVLPPGMRFFLSGRGALEYIISDIRLKYSAKSVALPSWCCDSMIIPFLKSGIEVRFYTFDDEDDIPDCDILFCMEHFGYIRQKKVIDFSGIVIHDLTHSVFSDNYGIKRVTSAKAQYFFGSLRKWTGFKTGGFAWILDGTFEALMPEASNAEYITLRQEAMSEKENYITGKTTSKKYLDLFSKAEDMLDDDGYGVACMSDIEAVSYLDVDFIKKRRRENALCLLEEVRDIAIYSEVQEGDVPLFVPIRLTNEKRNALRKFLIENKVFCPIHWGLSEFYKISKEQKEIYEEELSLVCDQRYSEKDMQFMCELINKFRRCDG